MPRIRKPDCYTVRFEKHLSEFIRAEARKNRRTLAQQLAFVVEDYRDRSEANHKRAQPRMPLAAGTTA
jgi:hypothetical protein